MMRWIRLAAILLFISCDTSGLRNISRVRMVDTSALRSNRTMSFYGFLCGLISNNFDISNIYIDSVFKIVGTETDGLEKF